MCAQKNYTLVLYKEIITGAEKKSKYLLSSFYMLNAQLQALHVLPPLISQQHMSWVLFLLLFYWCKNSGLEKLSVPSSHSYLVAKVDFESIHSNFRSLTHNHYPIILF